MLNKFLNIILSMVEIIFVILFSYIAIAYSGSSTAYAKTLVIMFSILALIIFLQVILNFMKNKNTLSILTSVICIVYISSFYFIYHEIMPVVVAINIAIYLLNIINTFLTKRSD